MINIGDKFGRLTIIRELKRRSKDGRKIYACKCDCGKIVEVRSKELLNGDTISCNCYRKDTLEGMKNDDDKTSDNSSCVNDFEFCVYY